MKSKFGILVLMVACKTAGSGGGTASTHDPKPLLLRLERTPCFGSCPAYSVDVDTDGAVRFEGELHVATDMASGHLDPLAIAALRAAIERSQFWTTPEKCCDCPDWTDAPGARLTIGDGHPPKTIYDYHGCEATPKAIRELEDSIDDIIGIEKWTGKKGKR